MGAGSRTRGDAGPDVRAARRTSNGPRHARTVPGVTAATRPAHSRAKSNRSGRSAAATLEPELRPDDTATGASGSWHHGAAALALAGIVIGVANYGGALVMTRIVAAHEFSRYAAGQSLLLVIGTGSMAALPWAVSRFLVSPEYSRSRSEAMHFGLRSSALQGLVLGVVALAAAWSIGGPGFGVAVGSAAFAISLIAGPIGFFQGEGRLGVVAVLRVLETVVRIAVGFALVLLVSRSASLGLLGFTAGGFATAALAVWLARYAFPLRRLDRAVARRLATQAVLLGAVQVLLAMLGALDTVYVAAGHYSATDAASYQTAALIGRVPLFISTALCTAVYAPMVGAAGERLAGRALQAGVRQYGWLMVPFLLACVTVPHDLLTILIPAEYTRAQSLLRLTCVLGVLIGAVNVLTTAHQARAFYRGAITVLAVVAAAQAAALLLASRFGGITSFAVAGVAVVAVGFLALCVDGRRWLSVPSVRVTAPGLVAVAAVVAAVVLRSNGPAWIGCVAVLSVVCVLQAFRKPHPEPTPTPTSEEG